MKHTLRLLALLAFTAFSAFGQDITETIPAGQAVTLLATADGVPAPTFEWFRNGVKIAEGATLILPALTTNDNGTYHVVAKNSEGSATSTNRYVLTVDDTLPPTFATAPLDQTVKEGDAVKLSVVVLGNPAPTLQWRKNGTPIAGATNATLTFAPVMRTDAGSYDVVASSEKGSVTSSPALLIVQYAPSAPIITRALTSVSVPKKSTYTFEFGVIGADSIRWMKGNSYIAGQTSSSLTLRDIKPRDAGTYTAIGSSPGGTVSSKAQLFVY